MEPVRVRELRRRLGLSQERFARILGVSLQSVRRWESGLTTPLPLITAKLEELERSVGPESTTGDGPMTNERRGTGDPHLDVSLGGLFKGLGSFLDLVGQMGDQGAPEVRHTGEIEGLPGKVSGVYGFTFKVGLGGEPIIQQFGNIHNTETGAVVDETREPVVDVLDEEREIVVIAELPGVEEQDVDLCLTGDRLEISAARAGRKYYKDVSLPAPVERQSLKSSCMFGILEIRLQKA